MKKLILKAVLLFILMSPALGEDEGILPDEIPRDAQRRGPYSDRGSELYYYYHSGVDIVPANVAATEEYRAKVLFERKFMKDGKLHGVQRKWFPNGKLRTEEMYRDGIRDGVFRVWSETGVLVGEFSIVQGTGASTVYNLSGQLIAENHYKNNQREGLQMERNAERITLSRERSGVRDGMILSFFAASGQLASLGFSSRSLQLGPMITYSERGSVETVSWHTGRMDDQLVTSSEYAAAQAAAPTLLPPYYSDIDEYKKLVTDDVKAVIEKYRQMPRVKIPLLFDKDGTPVLDK